MSPIEIVILGAGGPGRDVLDIIRDINTQSPNSVYQCVGFLDNDPEKSGSIINDIEVLGEVSLAKDLDSSVQFVNTIGGASYFSQIPEIISDAGIEDERFETIIHPDAYVADSASLGDGVVIYPQSVIHSGAEIGDHVMVKDARVSHDQIIGDYTRIEAGVCMDAGADIGKCCYLGMNSAVRESIDDFVLVGMGSVVVDQIGFGKVIVGNPAKHIRDVKNVEHK